MDYQTVMAELKRSGTAQARKIYARHGVRGDQYGVSYAVLGRLKKQIKTDHALAVALWASGNHDARVLATMVADPEQIDLRLATAWSKDLDNYGLSDALAGLLAKSPKVRDRYARWTKSKNEWLGVLGYGILNRRALDVDTPVDEIVNDQVLAGYIAEIEKSIHGRPNRTRHAMNMALVAIGVRNPRLQKLALEAAKRIGKVEVDHGQTSCQTPDAAAYIKKTLAHRKNARRLIKVRSC